MKVSLTDEEKRKKHNEYMRLWRINNPEAARRNDARKRAKSKDKQKVLAKKWYDENKELCKQRARKHYQTNRQRHYENVKQWRLDNPDKCTQYGKKWRKANSDAVTHLTRKRQAQQLRAMPSWANEFFIAEAYALSKLREEVIGGKWQVDHIIPLQHNLVCGLHCEANLRVIPAVVNMKKGNRWSDNIQYGFLG